MNISSPTFRYFVTTLLTIFLLVPSHASNASTTHYAINVLGSDPEFVVRFQGGIKTPGGADDVNIVSGSPGFLNGISGTTGDISVTPPGLNTTVLVALAIHVTDSAGPSHSVSSMNDTALADLVTDLNHSAVTGPVNPTAYAFSAAPPQFASAVSALSLSEAALGGQPFDILLSATPPGLYRAWSLDLSQEINNLDGIIAISVTDIGAIPEPTGLFCLFGPALLVRRRS